MKLEADLSWALQKARHAIIGVFEASKGDSSVGALARTATHDWCNRLPDAIVEKGVDGGFSSRQWALSAAWAIVRFAWSSRGKFGPVEPNCPQPPGPAAFAVLDWSRRRLEENSAIGSALATIGYVEIVPRMTIWVRLRITLRAISFVFAIRRQQERAYAWIEELGLKEIAELREAGMSVRSVVPRRSTVALNYCVLPVLVDQVINDAKRQKAKHLVLINRSGGRQLASIVYFLRPSVPVRSIHVVHSSATGLSFPESIVFGDCVITRSRRQAADLLLGLGGERFAEIVPGGRIVGGLEGSGLQERCSGILVALTQRVAGDFSEDELSELLALFQHFSAVSPGRVSVRFKDGERARKSFRGTVPDEFLDCISGQSLWDDLAMHEVVVIVSWLGYASTILQDAVFQARPVITTELPNGAEGFGSTINPTCLRASAFVPYSALLQSDLQEVLNCAARAEDLSSDEFEGVLSAADFAAIVEGVSRREAACSMRRDPGEFSRG